MPVIDYHDPAGLFHQIKRRRDKRDELFVTLGGKACFASVYNVARWLYRRAKDKPIDVDAAHLSCWRVADFDEGQQPGPELSELTPEDALERLGQLCRG